VVEHVAANPSVKVGVGYHFFTQQLANRSFFNDLLVELNYYHAKGSMNGQVWLGGDPEFNYWTFRAPFSSTRLMLDVKPSLFTYQHISPYPIVGLGMAWTQLAFNETPVFQTAADQGAYTNLRSQLNRKINYDLGLGARYAVTDHLAVSLEYMCITGWVISLLLPMQMQVTR
jgi:opacity protein-like surface antigen